MASRNQNPPQPVIELQSQVEADGGQVLATYKEPVGDHWQLFALLPIDILDPTPFQRDISRTHAERLVKVIKKLDRFVDPVVAVRSEDGRYWTPNGNHRRQALLKLKAEFVPVILIPEQEIAFKILALNTEKAHNLKEKSLEVIRMYRALAETRPGKTEEDFAFEFEEASYITLGLLYERHPRFAGGVFSPILKRVDGFLSVKLARGLEQREKRADQVDAANDLLSDAVNLLKKRGVNHPYVKNFIIARCNPLSRARKRLPDFETAFSKLEENLTKFDPGSIRYEDIARASVFAASS
ncbi:MAG TPA: ParB N-terminal domain-containing protein [Blastocatellia bacterium]|nr:ParB N-terminal domain-containing protein [Blastocatellia bacterium]